MHTELEKQDTKPEKKADSKSYPERQLAKMLKGRPIKIPDTQHHLIVGDSRHMQEIDDESVHLIVTSPPYPMVDIWDDLFQKKGCFDFQAMHKYLAKVWSECHRILINGGIACINIGDALRKMDDNFQLYANHAKIIEHCENLGFTSLPYILWKKPTSRVNAFLGSGFIPPNAYITQDCEFILLFRKGQPRPFPPKDLIRYASHYTIKERNIWFSQIWKLPGARQESRHVSRRVAAFPEEIPYRLIRMFSVIGDTVVDPFLGTGTTMKAARDTHRNSIGYEIDENLLPIIESRLSDSDPLKPSKRRKSIEGFYISHQKM